MTNKTKECQNSQSCSKVWEVVVIGAGAAGMMCAATAGYQGAKVLVVDHAPKAGAKIRISGGGKANFTNLNVTPDHYICANPHFVKSALARYTPQDFIELVERHGLEYEQREQGKLFCAHRASDLIQVLRTECDWAGVSFQLNTVIEQVDFNEGCYRLDTSQGGIQAQKLVVATGGLSFPKLKASGLGYELAQQFGLPVLPQRPGLVPLAVPKSWQAFVSDLSGVSLEVEACAGGRCFQEPMLFAHFGLSGPAILQVSNYWQKGEPLRLNLLPQIGGQPAVFEALKAIKQAGGRLESWLQGYWSKRFVKAWLNRYPLYQAETLPLNLAEVRDEALLTYAQQLTEWTLYPSDTAGYDKAEVTLGGVDTDAVSSKTFEAKQQPGLYFIGEVLDVTGHLGGYNFQWAWSSAVACGLALVKEKKE